MKELTSKKEVYDAMNDGSSSDGSDSAPSEDNLSDDEMQKIMPITIRKKDGNKKSMLEALWKRKEEKLKEIEAARKEKERSMQKPQIKKIFVWNPFNDRLRLNRVKKIETTDAWT